MTYNETKFSNLDKYSKKEKRIIQSKFPFTVCLDKLDNIEILGQRVDRSDISLTTKFCPLCDLPMIVRIMYIPCEHVVCYSCSLPESDSCYVCTNKIDKSIKIPDKTKLYECDYSNCFKFYESLDKLINHRLSEHSLPIDIAHNIIN